jgi:adenylate cyclase
MPMLPMTDNSIKRKLKVIFSADVQGYSKLMGDDDEHTVNTITTYRKIIAALIEKGHGRVVDAPGDNILAEFDSSLDAVKSAIAFQNVLKLENEKLPDNRRMDFRIGINLGDIIHKDDRIYGDGVNIAARIESLADPGGICISRGVYEQVDGKLEMGFADLGPHSVKNIKTPVTIFKVLLNPKDAGRVVGVPIAKALTRRWWVVAATTLVLLVGGAGIWYHQTKPEFEPASVDRMAYPMPLMAAISGRTVLTGWQRISLRYRMKSSST